MLIRLRTSALLFFLVVLCNLCSANELRLLTHDYIPLAYSHNNKPTGLAVEVVQELQRRLSKNVRIEVMPWARAYKVALLHKNIGLFTTMRTSEREHLFKWVGPIAVQTTSFYALHGSGLNIKNMAEAKSVDRILVPREYYSQQVLKKLGFKNLDSSMVRPDSMLLMLKQRRGKLMVADDQLLPSLLQQGGISNGEMELMFSFMRTSSYLAFSKDVPDAVVQQWQAELDNMKGDGSFARIYKKWMPHAIPP